MQNSTYIGQHLKYKQFFADIIEKNPMDTVLVASYDPKISNETLFCIGRWLVGCKIRYDQDLEEPILKEHEEYLVENFVKINTKKDEKYLQIIETMEGRLITFNMNSWKEIGQKTGKKLDQHDFDQYIQEVLLLKAIIDSLNRCIEGKKSFCKLYAVCQQPKREQQKKYDSQIKQFKSYINLPQTELVIISYSGKEGSIDEDIKIKNTEWKQGCPLGKAAIFGNRKYKELIELKTYQYIEGNEQNKIKTKLYKPCQQIEKILSEFVCVFFNILKQQTNLQKSFDRSVFSVVESPRRNRDFNQDFFQTKYDRFIKKHEIDETVKEAPQLPSYFTEIKPKQENLEFQVIPQLLEAHLFTQFSIMYKRLCSDKNLRQLKILFSNLLCLIGQFKPQYQFLSNCKIYLELLVDEIIVLKELSGGAEWAISRVENYIKANLPSSKSFYASILAVEIKENQGIPYYDTFLYLLEKNFDENNYRENQLIKVQDRKLDQTIKIKLEKLKAIEREFLGKNDQEIAKAISSMFGLYEEQSQMPEKQFIVSSSQILSLCAKMLRTIGKPDLAFTIYKKQKKIYKAEECLEELSLELNDNEKAKKYLQFSGYLEGIGFKEMAMKYSELSYESDEAQFQAMVKNKIRYISDKGEKSKEELKLLQEIEAKTKKPEAYFSGFEFNQKFKKTMRNLKDEVPPEQSALKVVFKKGKLTEKLGILKK